jgi:hypothetical protein
LLSSIDLVPVCLRRQPNRRTVPLECHEETLAPDREGSLVIVGLAVDKEYRHLILSA